MYFKCAKCNGHGHLEGRMTCDVCQGSGVMHVDPEDRTSTVQYKACEICTCDDCKTGKYREASWHCTAFNCQICDCCCKYDMNAEQMTINGKTVKHPRKKCMKVKCKHLAQQFNGII